MTATRQKLPNGLRFEIEAPIGMGLSKGKAGLRESANASLWLTFSICPAKFPHRQRIYPVPKEERDENTRITDSTKRRRLTPEIEGSLIIRQEAGDATGSPIGTLLHGPRYSSADYGDYGHAEYYSIEINLPENEFGQIRAAFLSGKQPSAITIWTPDVEYGDAPDGSDKVWEVLDAHTTFPTIVGFLMELSTDIPRVGVGPKKTENEEENEREETVKLKEAILHSREDIQLLRYGQATLNFSVDILNSSVVSLRRQVYILIVVAIFIAITAALHL